MNKIIVLQGCPCSGKSTWAHDFVRSQKGRWVIVNRDTYRYTIGKGKYTMDHEDKVNQMEEEVLKIALEHHDNLIIDATNLNEKTINRWKQWAKENNYELEFKQFYVSFEEACRRSKARRDAGGLYINKKVMMGFYQRYFPEKLADEFTDKRVIGEYTEGLPDAVICDLDGTLALHQGRTPFDWSRLSEDKADPRMLRTLNMYMENGVHVLFVTGRNETARNATEQWLSDQKLGVYWDLFVRADNDFSHGDDYKKKVYQEQIENKYNVIGVFEDSNKCVEMYRSLGLLCFQVANDDY